MNTFTFYPVIPNPVEQEDCAKETYHWLQFAESWVKIHKNKARAIECARKAESLARDDIEWHMCCDFWHSVIPDQEKEIECLLKAEKLIEDPLDFYSQYQYWERIGITEKAEECLKLFSQSDHSW